MQCEAAKAMSHSKCGGRTSNRVVCTEIFFFSFLRAKGCGAVLGATIGGSLASRAPTAVKRGACLLVVSSSVRRWPLPNVELSFCATTPKVREPVWILSFSRSSLVCKKKKEEKKTQEHGRENERKDCAI